MSLENFDPNSVGNINNTIFGLPIENPEDASLIIVPVPWEATVSFKEGTSNGPQAIFEASYQVDLFDHDAPDFWKKGIYMLPINEEIKFKSNEARQYAKTIIDSLAMGVSEEDDKIKTLTEKVNLASQFMNKWVEDTTAHYLKLNKHVALIGGDHSTPLGFMKAVENKFGEFAILQIDAHADLRLAYEGFTYSHASIMYNALQEIPSLHKLVQVGIRDYCDEEFEISNSNSKVETHYDFKIKRRQYQGENISTIWDEIVKTLPEKIFISFDIDGLDPKLCPNTGTPVPGGFEFEEIVFLLNKIVDAGKKIIAFDLNEVSVNPNRSIDIDAVVGARMLYKLCNLMLKSNA